MSHRVHHLAVRAGAVALVAGATLGFGGVAQAAPSPVQPTVSCYWDNGDGTFTFDVGYTNSSASTITYPVGPQNYVSPGQQDLGQPTVFDPGTHANVWAPTIAASDLAGADWVVNGKKASTNINKLSQCPTKPVPIAGSASGVVIAVAVTMLVGVAGFRYRTQFRNLRDRVRFGRI